MNVNLIEKNQFEKNRKYPDQYYSLKVLISGKEYYPVKAFSDKTAAYNAMIKHYKNNASKCKCPMLKIVYRIDKYCCPFGHIINSEIYSIEGEI